MSRCRLLPAGFLLTVIAACGGSPLQPTASQLLPKDIQLQAADVIFKPATGDMIQRNLSFQSTDQTQKLSGFGCSLVVNPSTGTAQCNIGGTLDLNLDYAVAAMPRDGSGFPLDTAGHLQCNSDALFRGEIWIRGQKVTRTYKETHVAEGCAIVTITDGAFKIVDSTGRIE
jgi:hypothetical protein